MRAFRVLAAALAIALAGCSGPPVPPAGTGIGAAHGSAGSWTVSATLEAYPDGTVKACYLMLLSYPSDCDGLPVTQVGATRLPFSQRAMTRGAYLTPTMKLTGTWTGSSLALTEPPTQTATQTLELTVWSSTAPPPVPQMKAGMPTAAGLRDQEVLMADYPDLERRGIVVMGNGFDETGLFMLVAAADPASVDLLRSRYNVHQIDTWLHPVP